MRISLDQPEIEQAIREYLSNKGITFADPDYPIEFTQRRLPSTQITAEIDLGSPADTQPEAEAPKQRRVRSKPVEIEQTSPEPAPAPVVDTLPNDEDPPFDPDPVALPVFTPNADVPIAGPGAAQGLFSTPTPTAETEVPPPDANGKISLFG